MARHPRLTALRLLLAVAAVRALVVGIPGTVAPRSFYDDFPWFSSWVSLLPPYNQHLVADVGGLQLAFGLLLAYAALRPARELVVPLAVVWTIAEAHHFAYHATHLGAFPTGDAIAQTSVLAVNVLVPVLVVGMAAPRRPCPVSSHAARR